MSIERMLEMYGECVFFTQHFIIPARAFHFLQGSRATKEII